MHSALLVLTDALFLKPPKPQTNYAEVFEGNLSTIVTGLLAVVVLVFVVQWLIDLFTSQPPRPKRTVRVATPRRPSRPKRTVLVDGSNVMHWKDSTPKLSTVRAVVDELRRLGYNPGVMFDANAGYKISDRYQDDEAFALSLDLPDSQVFVVPKGTQADPYLLSMASDMKAPIVTNDRFRDWAEQHPIVQQPGTLIRGGYRDGVLWLDIAAPASVAPGRVNARR